MWNYDAVDAYRRELDESEVATPDTLTAARAEFIAELDTVTVQRAAAPAATSSACCMHTAPCQCGECRYCSERGCQCNQEGE